MRYMFLVYSAETPQGPSAEEVEHLIRTHAAVTADARRKGVLIGCDALKPTVTATTVRSRDGKAREPRFRGPGERNRKRSGLVRRIEP